MTLCPRMLMGSVRYWVVVAAPFPYGGGGRRSFKVLKNLVHFGVIPILYIPDSNLLANLIFERLTGQRAIENVIKDLESSGVIIPGKLYEYIRSLQEEVSQLIDKIERMRKSSPFAIFSETIDSLNFLKKIRDDVLGIRHLLVEAANYSSKDIEVVYSMHEIPSIVFIGSFLAKSLGKELYVLLQLEPFRSLKECLVDDWRFNVPFEKRNILREILRLIALTFRLCLTNAKFCYEYAYRQGVLSGLLAVSSAPLLLSHLDEWSKRRGVTTRIIRPGNSVDEEIALYACEKARRSLVMKKEDFAIYFCRLNPMKGLYEVPYIAKKLERAGYKLVVAGKFDRIADERRFHKLCRDRGVRNIEYLGWLPRSKLLDVLSRAKVLIYPSHIDSFSLVVLESLFLGCSVVAYDIPAIVSVYGGLRPMRIVREYDCLRMADEAITLLKRGIRDHEDEHFDERFLNFLRMHSSWKNVAGAEVNIIRELRVRK